MRFEIHCHSTFSDGRHTPEEMMLQAKKIGLDGMVLTDHDVLKGSLKLSELDSPEFRIYPGVEVSSKHGHILAINVRTNIPKGLSAAETVEKIHEAGGIAIAAHPYDRYRRGVGDEILTAGFDAVEVVNGHTFGNRKDPKEMVLSKKIPMTGGTDAHTVKELGGVTIEVPNDLIEDIKAGNITIHRSNTLYLVINHGIGILKRRFHKHIWKKIRK